MTDDMEQACQLYRQLHAQLPNIVALSDDGLVRIVGDDIACIATALASRERAVWLEAVKAVENGNFLSTESLEYKWGQQVAAMLRRQAEAVKP